jgi:hypothetical protein
MTEIRPKRSRPRLQRTTLPKVAHLLLIYDRDAGRLVRQEVYETSGDAMQARFAAETEFAGRIEIEIVALVAESEEAARVTHGRYFLGLSELSKRIA